MFCVVVYMFVLLFTCFVLLFTRFVYLKRADDAGEDYEQLKLLDSCAQDLDRLERKRKKKNPDPGFSGDLSVHLSNHLSICLPIHPF